MTDFLKYNYLSDLKGALASHLHIQKKLHGRWAEQDSTQNPHHKCMLVKEKQVTKTVRISESVSAVSVFFFSHCNRQHVLLTPAGMCSFHPDALNADHSVHVHEYENFHTDFILFPYFTFSCSSSHGGQMCVKCTGQSNWIHNRFLQVITCHFSFWSKSQKDPINLSWSFFSVSWFIWCSCSSSSSWSTHSNSWHQKSWQNIGRRNVIQAVTKVVLEQRFTQTFQS